MILFAEKMWVAFAMQKLSKSYSHFFSKKFQYIRVSLDLNFNKSLTNDIVSFEQLGPDKYFLVWAWKHMLRYSLEVPQRQIIMKKPIQKCWKFYNQKMKIFK